MIFLPFAYFIYMMLFDIISRVKCEDKEGSTF